MFICPEFKKESNMDGWKYVTESGRKESGFENLKTRFQDCNLSRKQESKTDGMIESKQSFNRERKLSVFVERLKGTRIRRKKSFLLSGFLYGTKENTLSVNLNGWKTIKMYHNNSK
jgi:hypothetical protein bacD2_04641